MNDFMENKGFSNYLGKNIAILSTHFSQILRQKTTSFNLEINSFYFSIDYITATRTLLFFDITKEYFLSTKISQEIKSRKSRYKYKIILLAN